VQGGYRKSESYINQAGVPFLKLENYIIKIYLNEGYKNEL